MLFSTSVTIWWKSWDFCCPLSHLPDCSRVNNAEHASTGDAAVCVCMYCVSLSVLSLPQKMTFSMICTTQLQSPQCRCWKSTLSVLWRLQPPQWIMQFTNTLENAQNATEQLLTLYKASAAPGARTGRDVWHWVGMSGTESVFAELFQTLLFGLKYLPLRLRLQRCEGRKEHHDGPRGG